ncbi:putative disease resistance protein RGA4 [Ananas comosus]|uniref:Disease resistance protein RGA4 n=1 Tax=Ananas comosus TaxID=4615 RepID=A0A6P5H988_ANACO|nr:putative disease resistance protein RGA4 [Ananas comosus]
MAMIADAFMKRSIAALEGFVGGELCAALGVRGDAERLLRTMARVGGALAVAERRRAADLKVDAWVAEVKDLLYEIDDVADLCAIEGAKMLEEIPSTSSSSSSSTVRCSSFGLFSCFSCRRFHHEIGLRIRDLNERLKEIDEAKAKLPALMMPISPSSEETGDSFRQIRSLDVKFSVVGTQIEKASHSLVNSMLKGGKKKVELFAIVGAGGIGKTTLARKIYDDERIADNFPIRVWLRVPMSFSEVDLLKEVIRSAGGDCGEVESKDELISCFASVLSRRFLIVLDDVRNPDKWEDLLKDSLNDGVARGRILITTRDVNAARSMKAVVHTAEKMDTENGWTLLRNEVSAADSEEEAIKSAKEVGIKLVEKCDGLPLAIKVVAGVLRSREKRRIEWEKVLKSEIWSTNQLQEDFPQALYLAYEDLPSNLKQCFLYCSLYPRDYPMLSSDLIQCWIAEGFIPTHNNVLMEDLAEEYYRELVGRNLLQPDLNNLDKLSSTMHDVIRLFAEFLIRDETIFVGGGRRSSISPLTKPRHVSICCAEGNLELPISVKQQKSLRTLLFFDSINLRAIEDAFIQTLGCLRVLDLSNTAIESLPSSIGDLVHLRYLNLDKTNIKELPLLIGSLVNLQTLRLEDCQFLHTLPKSITELLELRRLCLARTPLSHVPRGIGNLRHINYLSGLVIGHEINQNEYSEGCGLEELQPLSELRYLQLEKLERAPSGAKALTSKPFLKELYLHGKAPAEEGDEPINAEAEVQQSEKIWNQISPPPTIEKLLIRYCSGGRFPNWIMASLDKSFPHLSYLEISSCRFCTRLPPLGLLPQLKYLLVSEAEAVIAVGAELFGAEAEAAFPKLEVLTIKHMTNWQEWSFGLEKETPDDKEKEAPKLLFPCLRSLDIRLCPKLRALPKGLDLVPNLKTLHIEGAHNLMEIRDLPSLTDLLSVKNNKGLLRISGITSLQSLIIDDCSKLKHVDRLNSLQHLSLVYPPSTETFFFEELVIFWSVGFPRWLSGLLLKQENVGSTVSRSVRSFDLRCSLPLLRSCLEGGKNWQFIRQVPEVRAASSDGKAFLRYSKSPRKYETNVGSVD